MSLGKDITTSDNNKAFLEANDEIRGVETTCYGTCPSGTCIEDGVQIHGINWRPDQLCIDGGVIRANKTYTNLDASGFKTPIGYSGHFYGIRKYDGLIPHAPYNIIVHGQTGTTDRIKVPPEFQEVEYGINNYVGYSGIKLSAPSSYRSSGDKYGTSIDIKNNILVIGAPYTNIPYFEYDDSGNLNSYNLENAGIVYIYKREDRPSGTWPIDKDSSPWSLHTALTLPSSILKDFYTENTIYSFDGISLPLPVTERTWHVGQEGREFGYSVALSSSVSGDRNIVVVGAPSARWNNRTFQELQSSGVQICLMVFSDEFVPSYPKRDFAGNIIYDSQGQAIIIEESSIRSAIKNKDIVFQYFSNPPVKFDIKIVFCEPLSDYSSKIPLNFPEPKPNYIFKNTISRNQGLISSQQTEKIISGIKDSFHQAFPYDTSKLNNNIPPILCYYVDNSASLGVESIQPALNEFLKYYQEYSFASGLKDFYNERASGSVTEFNAPLSEKWIDATINMVNYVLDTGRLLTDNQIRFFTSGVGAEAFNTNLSRFNYPPSSGGRVYIFEEENNSWNLIQEVKAISSTYDAFDRFGHSVDISENGEVIVIGSPYTNETCKALEYKPNEKSRLFNQISSWLGYKSSKTGGIHPRYTGLIDNYQSWLSISGFNYANHALYTALTQDEKFEARTYLKIEEYQLAFDYRGVTGEINYGQDLSWSVIVDNYAASPRLGYSSAVNEDGSIIAFGAPTDGFNKFDDARVYYQNLGYKNEQSPELNTELILKSWASNVNAGAVRVFEARKYYPHNKVIEYGKFGNLHKSLAQLDESGHFSYLNSVFANRNFEVTPFAETDIPDEAGLVFIITPEIDAISDEIMEKIIHWLSLGDRNLVLVGNDPVWENNGAYAKSNEIINKILSRLDSRMKLYPARNYIESCSSECSIAIASTRPNGATQSYIQPLDMGIYGVADIRTNFDNIPSWKTLNLSMPCTNNATNFITGGKLPSTNTKCELPLKNGGDLRAEWEASCQDCALKNKLYYVNLPYLFGSVQPPCCDIAEAEFQDFIIDAPNQEPIPLLAAATNVNNTVIIPAKPAVSGFRPIISYETINKSTSFTFIDTNASVSGTTIFWNASGNNASIINTNLFNTASQGLFYEPLAFEDRQGILQGNGIPAQEVVKRFITTESDVCLVAQDNYTDTSKIIAIASLQLETSSLLYVDDDSNINFYLNLVAKPNQRGGSRIAQLGGWTGRSSFISANKDSILYEIFSNANNDVKLNVTKLSIIDDVCWIANPNGLPSESELQDLKSWLNFSNKRLIITYDGSQSQARIANSLLEMLNSKLKPIYSPSTENFKQVSFTGTLDINPLHFSSFGSLPKYNLTQFKLFTGISFIPLENVNNIIPIISIKNRSVDTVYDTVGYWKTETGMVKASFPAIPGSGYKIFVSLVSETPSENIPINLIVANASRQLSIPYPNKNTAFAYKSSNPKYDTINNVGLVATISNSIANRINTVSYDVQVLEDASTLDIYLHCDNERLPTITNQYIPKTTRILGISGILLPVVTTRTTESFVRPKIERYEAYEITPSEPEKIITTQRFTYFSNLNDQYCGGENCVASGFNNQYIADGPVVAAQEVEHLSSFEVGVARSRITLLSDASLVQGSCLGDDNFRMSPNSVAFLTSLYPITNFPSNNFGRQYNIKDKLVAPDRGSPQKYYSLIQNSGLNTLFRGNNAGVQNKFLSAFTSIDSNYDPEYVVDPDPLYLPDEEGTNLKKEKIAEALKEFEEDQWRFGGSARFSGIIENKLYTDAGIGGGMPQLMKDKGYDYLDFDRFPSGYPGDLFGYSIALSNNKLIVGAPFAGFSHESPKPWSYFISGGQGSFQSGIKVGYNGGAGAVYVFERNFNGSGLHGSKARWDMVQKIKPDSINVGQDFSTSGIATSIIGNHGYDDMSIRNLSIIGDRFGSSIDINSDALIVGAPGHDFESLYINGTGSFIRKCFNEEFNIPSRTFYDLGSSGVRQTFLNSGSYIPNNGAIFAFENNIYDWQNKKQKWKLVEKVTQQASVDRIYGTENSYFGSCVKIHRTNRSDADYTIVSASTNNSYDSSGQQLLNNAGSSYIYDVMLRDQIPSIPNQSAYIDARIFGEKDLNNNQEVRIIVQNSGQNMANYYASGIVYSDLRGQIFIEASGQDPSIRGFIAHRPYIVSIDGKYAYGAPNSGQFNLFISGKSGDLSGNMTLFNKVDNEAIVYNNLGLYNGAIIDFATGSPSGLYLYTDCPDAISISESGLCLYTASGIGLITDALNLRIRGK